MDSKIALFAFVVAIAVALPAARAMSCYECSTSMSDDNSSNCTSLLNIQASQCSSEHFNKINKLSLPHEILKIFDGFRLSSGGYSPEMKWRCAKLYITGKMNGPQSNYTIRTCVPEVFNLNFCNNVTQAINAGSQSYNNYHVGHCSTCENDSCNSASSMSLSLLPILAIFAVSSYVLKA